MFSRQRKVTLARVQRSTESQVGTTTGWQWTLELFLRITNRKPQEIVAVTQLAAKRLIGPFSILLINEKVHPITFHVFFSDKPTISKHFVRFSRFLETIGTL